MAVTRVVLTGPECTGKTTLAAVLAARHAAPWVPEASRRFVERLRDDPRRDGHHGDEGVPDELSAATVDPIARLAIALQEAALAAAPPLLFLDTDLASTVVYARHYYGACPAWIEREARARRADLYLLGAPDLPWTPDGVRDRPTHREALFAAFADVLHAIGARVVVVRGAGQARTAAAVRAVDALLNASGPASAP